jgi:myo-inositol-1(or 4)-monophosphatase
VASGESSALLDLAVRAAHAAAEIVRRGATGLATLQWEQKGPQDYVSDVDRASEEALRTMLLGEIPEAQVLGEELSPDVGADRGIIFVVDPLDGTTNFLHGFPEYAVSIGVLVDGVLVAGVVRHVVTGETYTALAGSGAKRDGAPIRVSSTTNPQRALIGTGFPFSSMDRIDEYLPQFAAVASHTAGMRRAGSAALDLAHVAAGQFDAFWELKLAPWDIAAGLLLVREAGGVVTDLSGAPAAVAHTGLVAGNPTMHKWLLDTLTRASSDRGMGAI